MVLVVVSTHLWAGLESSKSQDWFSHAGGRCWVLGPVSAHRWVEPILGSLAVGPGDPGVAVLSHVILGQMSTTGGCSCSQGITDPLVGKSNLQCFWMLGTLGSRLVLVHWCVGSGPGPSSGQGSFPGWLWTQGVLQQQACWWVGPRLHLGSCLD